MSSILSHVPPFLLDPLERAVRTFVQQFTVVLLAVGSSGLLVHQSWAVALDSAAFAAIVSILTSVLTARVKPLSVQLDVLVRVAKTFLQSFLGTLTATNMLSVAHADWKGALAVAVPVALTALLTSLVALSVPGTKSGASLLPAPAAVADPQDALLGV